MAESSAELWWDEITGPSQMVRNAATMLRNGRSVQLKVPVDLPWPDQMRMSMERELREDAEELLVDFVDCRWECPQDPADIGEFLLGRYAVGSVRDGYRKSSKQSVQAYMLANHVLKNRVIWVLGLTEETVKDWLAFCREYKPRAAEDGLFVLECVEEDMDKAHRDSHALPVFVYLEYASYHDLLLFSNQICSPIRASLERKQYLAAAATELCGRDAELADMLLQYLSETDTGEDPLNALEELSQAEWGTDRFNNVRPGPEHPFALIWNENKAELERRLWRAQLQALFPLIEYEHVEFVNHFYYSILMGLKDGYADHLHGWSGPQYITKLDERIMDPYDVELGLLYLMSKLRSWRADSMYLLYLAEEGDRERLSLLRDMRNQLAHIEVCPSEKVCEFLDSYPYEWCSYAPGPEHME